MNFARLREALRQARRQAVVEDGGVRKIGMTLDQAAVASGLNRATIHAIENIKREPDLKPELETIEKLAHAYALTLSALFARLEGGSSPVPPRPEEDLDESPHFDTEERIAEAVYRRLLQFAVAGDARKRAADDRLSADPGAVAAERRAPPRATRAGDVSQDAEGRRAPRLTDPGETAPTEEDE